MKKTIITIAILLGLSMTTFADGGGLFQRDNNAENGKSGYVLYDREVYMLFDRDVTPLLPLHDLTTDQDADETPLGSGIVLLAGLGAAYLVGKKRKEE